jgi:putative ABC transport system substrate-binding protein
MAAKAQQPKMPVIGYLSTTSSAEAAPVLAAFREGLREAGYVEGENFAIEQRFADNQYARRPELALDLVRRRVDVIAGIPGVAALAAKAATTTIPVVFETATDPVQGGFVSSFNRPEVT